jgi:hypothetical protein
MKIELENMERILGGLEKEGRIRTSNEIIMLLYFTIILTFNTDKFHRLDIYH